MNLPGIPVWLLYILFFWSLLWKGIALWRASRQSQRNWFIALLIVNTFGIAEIVYLFFFSKKKLTILEIKHWLRNAFFTKAK